MYKYILGEDFRLLAWDDKMAAKPSKEQVLLIVDVKELDNDMDQFNANCNFLHF